MFQASIHGWPFEDSYTCTGPQLGLDNPPPHMGLGGGMAWAALDRYLRGASIARSTPAPEPGDALHEEFVARQVAALSGVWPRVRQWQSRPAGSWRDGLPFYVPWGGDTASLTRSAWPPIRRRLDADQPVLLTLLEDASGYTRARAVRQVLATGWRREGVRIRITLYDPSCPDDEDVELAFNRSGPLDARVSGERPLRGFFGVEYDRRPRPVVRTEAFDDRLVIGLNRRVRGRVAAAASRRRLDMAGRNDRGALLHFHRIDGRNWEGMNVTESAGFEAHEVHSDPTAIRHGGALHVFARNYVGDLLHFRLGRSWSLKNRTEGKRAGARFRLAGRPVAVAGPWLEMNVLGRDAGGGLVHYQGQPFRGWRAEQVAGDPVSSDPVARQVGDALHVVGVAGDGRVLHWVNDEVWGATDTSAGPGPSLRLAGAPRLVTQGDDVLIIGRTHDSGLAVLRMSEYGLWSREIVAEDISGDPVATTGPSGLHLFAPTTAGGLVHAWPLDDGWRQEDVVATRTTLTPDAPGEADVVAWGSTDALRVFVRRGRQVRAFGWAPDTGWWADVMTERAGTPLALLRDRKGGPHVLCTDPRGTIVHLETADWREPKRSDAPAAEVEAGNRPGPEPEDENTPDSAVEYGNASELDVEEGITPEPELESEPEPELESEPEPESAPRIEGLPLLGESPEPDLGTEPDENHESRGTESSEPDELLDFEAERRAGTPPPVDPAGSNDPPPEEARREFRWEDDREPGVSREEIEPMDLSLLDTWPGSQSGSGQASKPADEADGSDREAS